MTSRLIVGMDLSGPTNRFDTAVVIAEEDQDRLHVRALHEGCDDVTLYALLGALDSGPLIAGIDAPLSYQPGGGDRVADRALRDVARAAGLPAGTVMTPTMTRMAYLTLRGLAVARLIAILRPDATIVEVHPATAFALRGAPVADLIAMKRSRAARVRLAAWAVEYGCVVDPRKIVARDHRIAALGAAIAAWDAARGRSRWEHPAAPPLHPFAVCA